MRRSRPLRERFDRALRRRVRDRHPARRGQLEGAGATARTCTRQICNGWRADDVVAAQVLSERTGRLAAQLMGYRGTRMLQDNCLWKPPGARSLGMHQDGSFADYLVPPEMITCWVALDDTRAQGGTIEYVRGSHRWPKVAARHAASSTPPRTGWRRRRGAAPEGEEPERVPVVVKAGGCYVPPLAHLPRLGRQRGDDAPPGARLPPDPGRDPLPPGQRGPRSTRATAAAATSRWTSRSSRCSGTRPAPAAPGWLSYRRCHRARPSTASPLR